MGDQMKLTLRHDGESLPVLIREATEADEALICHSWLKSYRDSEWARRMGNAVYYTQHHPIITSLLRDPEVSTRCIVHSDTPAMVLGWMCASPARRVVHYVSVKRQWRELGVARALLASYAVEWPPDCEIEHSHRTFYVDKITEKPHYKRRLKFNPYAFFNKTAD